MTDTRKYMILVDYMFQSNNSLEVWDYNLSKEAIPARIQELKDLAYINQQDIEAIQVCEHTDFITVEEDNANT